MLETDHSSIDTLSVLSAAPNNYLILLPDAPVFTIVAVTDAYLQATFTERAALIGKGIFEVFFNGPEHSDSQVARSLRASLDQVLCSREEHRMNDLQYDVKRLTDDAHTFRIWRPLNKPVVDCCGQVQYIIHWVEDITEDIRAMEKIKHQEEQYHSLIRNIPDFITRWNRDLKLIYANDSLKAWLGDRHRDFTGKTSSEMGYSDEVAQPWMEKLRQVFRTGDAAIEYTTADYGKGWGHFHSRLVPEKNAAGAVETVLAITTDITDFKKAEQELNESKNLLDAIVQAQAVSLSGFKAIRNASGRITDLEYTFANTVTKKMMYGLELKGMRITSVFPNIVQLGIMDAFINVIETGQPMDQEFIYSDDRLTGWFRGIAVKLGDGMVLNTQDITARKNVELALEQLTEKLQAAFDISTSILAILKSVRNEQGLVVDFICDFINHKGWELVGFDMNGKSVIEYFGHIRDIGLFDRFVRVVEDGVPMEDETHYQSGHFDFWIHWSAVKLEDGLFISVQDISQRKKAEEDFHEEHYFLEQVTDKTPHLIYVFDLEEQRFIYINRRIQELTGVMQDYVYGMGPHLFKKLMHPDDLNKRVDYLSRLSTLKEGEIREDEFRLQVGNNCCWFRSKDHVFKKENGSIKQIIGLAEDITYEKMIQEKFRRERGEVGLN